MHAAVGLDIGTTNVKAVLVGADGRAVATSHRTLQTQRQGTVSEQDAEELWVRTVDAVAELSAARPDVAARVGAIGVCSQYSSIVPVDAAAEPVGPMVMWSDHRGTDHSWDIMGRDEDAFLTWIDRHGIPTVGGGLALAHILHLQHDRPELTAATTAWLEPMDFVTARLTGRITATQHSMFMSQLCDNRTLGVTNYDDELVTLAGVDPDRLPPLIDIDEPVGNLTSAIADSLGLPVDAVVYAGSNDTAAGGVATGVARPGRAGLAIGTTSVLIDTVDEKNTDLDHEVLSMPALDRDSYLVFAENGYGGRVVEYLLHEIVHAADALADHMIDAPFAQLDEALAVGSAGAGGALFLPWLGGSLAPSAAPGMRGGFINVSLSTSRLDLIRAVTEGVAHNLGWLLPHVEAFTGETIEEIAFVGGAARSPQWTQILADVLDRTVAPVIDPDTAVARSVALLALARRGDLERAEVVAGAELGERFEPNPANRSLYDHHQTQFEAAYVALRPISESLTSFHGDPQ